jgi:hypothetical protein
MRDELKAQGAQVIYDRTCTICGKEIVGALMSRTPMSDATVKRAQRAVDSQPAFVCSGCSAQRHALWRAQAERLAEGVN